MADYHVKVIDHGARGAHWDTLRPVDEYLREHIEDMAAALRISQERGSYGDLARFDFDRGEDLADISDAVSESWYLDIAAARWLDGELARVELVTGTGGPHAEIVAVYSRTGELSHIEAHQYWSGHREAVTSAPQALETFEAFREAFLYLEPAE